MKTFLRILLLVLASSLVGSAAASKPGWTDDYDKAAAEAQSSGKMLLLDFTGSDWCPVCIDMDKEVFDTPQFKDYAAKNLVLLRVIEILDVEPRLIFAKGCLGPCLAIGLKGSEVMLGAGDESGVLQILRAFERREQVLHHCAIDADIFMLRRLP